MRGTRNGGMPADLAQLAGRFERWRQRRLFGTRIPEPLWHAAVQQARRYGLCQTARALKLGYYALKERLEAPEEPMPRRECPPDSNGAFVELAAGPLAVGSECMIEFEKPGGSRMRIHLQGNGMPDLAALGRAFWDAP